MENIEIQTMANIFAESEKDENNENPLYTVDGEIISLDNINTLNSYDDFMGAIHNDFFCEYTRLRREKEARIKEAPKHIAEYIERGKKVIFEKFHKDWEELVNKSFNGYFEGDDVKIALEIMEELSEVKKYSEFNKLLGWFYNLDLTEGKYYTVRKIVLDYSKNGVEFFKRTSSEINKKDAWNARVIDERNHRIMNEEHFKYPKYHMTLSKEQMNIINTYIEKIKYINGVMGAFVSAFEDEKKEIPKIHIIVEFDSHFTNVSDDEKYLKNLINEFNSDKRNKELNLIAEFGEISDFSSLMFDDTNIEMIRTLASGFILFDNNGDMTKKWEEYHEHVDLYNDTITIDNIMDIFNKEENKPKNKKRAKVKQKEEKVVE